MPKLTPLDLLVVDVLVDNVSDSYSSKPDYVLPEFTNVIDAGAKEISGESLCCAQLGLSLMLTGYVGGKRQKLLFDTGPEGAVLVRNSKGLGVGLSDVDGVALSHGHWDHMGGLTSALKAITDGKRKVPCHVNSDMFIERGVRLTDGRVVPFAKVPSVKTLTDHGAEVVNDLKERTFLDDFFYLSGEIPRHTSFEKGRQDHLCRSGESDAWRPDPLLMDERYLAVHLRDKGVLVFSSCSHAGIINVLQHAKANFGDKELYGVFGGLHLVGALEKIIPETVDQLKAFRLKQIVPAHCTGWRAVNALLNEFGETVVIPSAVGSRYTF